MYAPGGQAQRSQVRRPRVAQVVASALRDQILTGTLRDGGALPKQEDLLEEFNVSLPSLREALSILETEGLLTVQRGNVGGAIVHTPTPEQTAYTAALVLQSRRVTVDDVVSALRSLDPVFAALCAERKDRRRTIVPVLTETQAGARAALDADPERFARLARLFHEQMVDHCGNESLILMAGALDWIWGAHDDQLAIRTAQLGPALEKRARETTLVAHQRILDAIAAGDPRAAETASREHYAGPATHALLGRGLIVHAGLLHEPALLARRGYDERASAGVDASGAGRRVRDRSDTAPAAGHASSNGRRKSAGR
jgi:GntR family transcriptional regulator, transcriptional repressor for pyruvate dehydrogenase complex